MATVASVMCSRSKGNQRVPDEEEKSGYKAALLKLWTRATSNCCPLRRSLSTPERLLLLLLHGRWLKPRLHAFLMRPLTFSTIATTARRGIYASRCHGHTHNTDHAGERPSLTTINAMCTSKRCLPTLTHC